MGVIYFVPLGLIVVFALFLFGGIYSVLKNISKLIFNIFIIIFLCCGIYIAINGIIQAKDGKGLLYGVSKVIKGIFIALLLPLVNYILDIGMGHISFKKAIYVILGNFSTIDIYIASILVTIIVILLILCLNILEKNKHHHLLSITTIGLIFLIIMGLCKIALESEMDNNYDTVNWISPEYKTTQNTAIVHEPFLNIPLKTGMFKKDTLLYATGHSRTFKDIKYYEVTDKKSMGYVSVEHLQTIVQYSYFINTDSDLYGVEVRKTNVIGKNNAITVTYPSSRIIGKIKKGTKVDLIRKHAENLQIIKLLIRLSDGTEGYIDVNNVTEIRE